jgi:PHD/YefM family antitoxin component YafN of YafNO toxin-antitoxin module
MNYKWEFEKFWGKGAKPERIVLPAKDFDALVERLNEPPDPEAMTKIKRVLERKAPWDDDSEETTSN